MKLSWLEWAFILVFGFLFITLLSKAAEQSKKLQEEERRRPCMIWEIKSPTLGTYRTKGSPEFDEQWRGTGAVAGSVEFTDENGGGTVIVTPPYSAKYIGDKEPCK